uniref:CCHC-type domain-containing protein n=1 Tax=Trichogramma kaykai TaxID=54128 RepID=A0ABD2W534_9HYME
MSLEDFLDSIEYAKEIIDSAEEALLVKLVRTKIGEEARKGLKDIDIKTVAELKKQLRGLYSSGLTVSALQGLLAQQLQQPGESVLSFATKIRDLGNQIIQTKKLSLATGATIPKDFEENVKGSQEECFRKGLLDNISVRMKSTGSLTDLIKEAITIEKDLEVKSMMRRKLEKRCGNCGRTNHATEQCRVKRVNTVVTTTNNTHSNAHGNTSKKICTYCKKPGHLVDKCFKYVYDQVQKAKGSSKPPADSNAQSPCVGNNFPINFNGLFGAEFLLSNKAKIDFGKQQLTLNNLNIKLYFEDTPLNKPSKTAITNFQITGLSAQISLININLLPLGVTIVNKGNITIEGIEKRPKMTLGKTTRNIHGVKALFYVIDDTFHIPGNGILGVNFFHLSKAIVDFKTLRIHINDVISSIQIFERKDTLSINNDNISLKPVEIEYELYDDPDDFDALSPCDHIPEGYVFSIQKNDLKDLISTKNLKETEKDYVHGLIDRYKDIFHLPNETLPGTDCIQHRIITIDDDPINVKQYKYPHALKDEVNKQVQEMLDNDIIETSESPYNNPLWIVEKKPDSEGNKRWRIVLDFRALNDKTISDAYPLPNITEIFDQVGSANLSRNVPESPTDATVCTVTRSKANHPDEQNDEASCTEPSTQEQTIPKSNQKKKGRPPKHLQKPKPFIPPRDSTKRQTKQTQKFDPSIYQKQPEPDPKSFPIPPSDSENSVESDQESESENEQQNEPIDATSAQPSEKSYSTTNNKIVYSKGLMHCMDGNIAYFIDDQGQPVDEGARKLHEFNKLPKFSNISIGEVSFEVNKRVNHFALCIKEEKDISLSACKGNIKNTLFTLEAILKKREADIIFFTKSETIQGLPWSETIECISNAFQKSQIKIVICTGKLTLASLPSALPLRENDLVPTYQGYLKELVSRLNSLQKMAYDNLLSSKLRSKKYYDQHTNEKNFKPGDYVFLLSGSTNKKKDQYSGPFKILEILNNHNVRLQIKKKSKIVHANRIRISYIN